MKSSRSQALDHSLKLRGHAASMRSWHNAAEAGLWQCLRGARLGVWFRRQVVLLGSCIVDFYCPSARLVVEVDGAYHFTAERLRADARRDRRLAKAGYRVVRVSAALVLSDSAQAAAVVRRVLGG
jgi:very-short-patch-repair endonuclease